MLRYDYENATVYITKPTKKHLENIKKATENFMRKVIKEELQNESRERHRRVGIGYSNARKGTRQT